MRFWNGPDRQPTIAQPMIAQPTSPSETIRRTFVRRFGHSNTARPIVAIVPRSMEWKIASIDCRPAKSTIALAAYPQTGSSS
ncbi:hypothetical protein [Rubripirellula lacrimiformis]|uniref:hypothetical protein n=1 Tax=Rubripirellula lacrimiformis TaxID=1930273 RepID=UPI0011A7E7AC|nr:hypothetical protein [Rubripirellula lacrimiformis]